MRRSSMRKASRNLSHRLSSSSSMVQYEGIVLPIDSCLQGKSRHGEYV